MFEIVKLEPMTLTESEKKRLFELHQNVIQKYNHLNKIVAIESFERDYLGTFCSEDRQLFLMKNNESMRGLITYVKGANWRGETQYQMHLLAIEVPSNEEIHYLVHWIKPFIAQHGELAIIHNNDAFEAVLRMLNSEICLNANYYTLNKGEINREKIEAAAQTYAAQNKDLALIYINGITEEYIEDYCNLFMETQEDMPDVHEPAFIKYPLTVEKQRQNNESNQLTQTIHHSCIILNEEGKMVGMSNVRVSQNDPRFPYQFMIGVKRAYRGKHLGKWMYAEMYKRLYDTVPFEQVLVCHHPLNTSAIEVSKWVGYRYAYTEKLEIVGENALKETV